VAAVTREVCPTMDRHRKTLLLLTWFAAGLVVGGAFLAGWLLGRDVITPWINANAHAEEGR